MLHNRELAQSCDVGKMPCTRLGWRQVPEQNEIEMELKILILWLGLNRIKIY
jgi:hypothetical protein